MKISVIASTTQLPGVNRPSQLSRLSAAPTGIHQGSSNKQEIHANAENGSSADEYVHSRTKPGNRQARQVTGSTRPSEEPDDEDVAPSRRKPHYVNQDLEGWGMGLDRDPVGNTAQILPHQRRHRAETRSVDLTSTLTATKPARKGSAPVASSRSSARTDVPSARKQSTQKGSTAQVPRKQSNRPSNQLFEFGKSKLSPSKTVRHWLWIHFSYQILMSRSSRSWCDFH